MDNSSHSRSNLHWHADADAAVPVVISPAAEDFSDENQHRLVLLAVIDVDYGYSELNTAIAAAAAEKLRETFADKDRPQAISSALRWALMHALATAKQDTERLTGRSLTQISADAQLDGINMMAIAVNGNRIAIAHVGNCRLWGVRNGRSLYQIDYTAPKVEVTEQTFQTGDRYLIATPVIGDAFKSSEVAALLQQNQPDDELLTTLIDRARQHGLPQIAAAGVIGRGRVVPVPSSRSAPRPPNALPPPRAASGAWMAELDEAPGREKRASAPGGLIAGLTDATVSMIGIIALAAVTLITVLVLYVSARPAAAPEVVTPTATAPVPTLEATAPAEVTLPPTITRAPIEAPTRAPASRTPDTASAGEVITATVTVRPRTATPAATRTVTRTPAPTATGTRATKPTVTTTPALTATTQVTVTRNPPSITPTSRPTQTATRTVTRTPRPTSAATRRPRRTVVATTAPTVSSVATAQQEVTATAEPQPNPQPQPQPTSPPPPPPPTSPPPPPPPTSPPPPIPTALP